MFKLLINLITLICSFGTYNNELYSFGVSLNGEVSLSYVENNTYNIELPLQFNVYYDGVESTNDIVLTYTTEYDFLNLNVLNYFLVDNFFFEFELLECGIYSSGVDNIVYDFGFVGSITCDFEFNDNEYSLINSIYEFSSSIPLDSSIVDIQGLDMLLTDGVILDTYQSIYIEDLSSYYDNGYQNGLNVGYGNGYTQGERDGYNNGYSTGYEDGVRDSDVNNISWTDWLINAVSGFLDFEIFPNFTLSSVLGTIVAVLVAIWILKVMAGG